MVESAHNCIFTTLNSGDELLLLDDADWDDDDEVTVMVVDDEEAVFVNVIGQLNPAELAKVMDSFDVDVDLNMD